MKKNFTLYAVLVPLVMLFCISVAYAQQRTPQPVTFTKITDGVYEIRGGQGANSGCIIGDKQVVMIDAKMDEQSMRDILVKVKELTGNPITYVINTHSDGDHVTGNRYYPSNAIFISHENCRAEMLLPNRDGTVSNWISPELAPFLPSVTYRDKMTIHLGSEVAELWHFGIGHTTGDTVVNLPRQKIAFVADQIMSGRPQLIHAYKGGNSFGHVKNLTRMLETINAETFYNGHGTPVNRQDVVNHIEAMKARQDKVRNLMEKNLTLNDIKKLFDPKEGDLIEIIYGELKK
jgi:cyclase